MASAPNFINRIPPVTRTLIIINVIIWAFTAIFPAKMNTLVNFGALHYFTSPGFNPAQLLTYMFIHGGFTHLFFNMFALYVFGSALEYTFGDKRFLFYYISCGIGAALIQEGIFAIRIHSLASYIDPQSYQFIISDGWRAITQGMNYADPQFAQINILVNGPTVGASGAIYGVLAAFAMIYPNRPLYIMFIPVPVKAKWVVLGYALLEFSLGFGQVNDNVAHFAHLGGMIVGAAIVFIWKRKGIVHGDFY